MKTSNTSSKPGLGSNQMDEKMKNEIHSKGGKASAKSAKGSAGSTAAARRGGANSHSNR